MLDRLDPESLLVSHLEWVENVAAVVCRRNGVWGSDAEDFASSAKLKLMQDDYAALRKFRGECEFTTYLATLVTRHFLECMRERRGRWRNSAEAERRGGLAKELEALVRRDGWTVAEAGEKLRTAGKTTLSDAQLARLLGELPARAPLRPPEADPEVLEELPSQEETDGRVARTEARSLRAMVMDALKRSMDRMGAEDALVLRMLFADGRPLAEVARALKLDYMRLYRRLPKLREMLRQYLEESGVRDHHLREILGGEDDDAS
jgi:RNA polymerase sigma factor for flagellar operon FliA